MAAPAETIICLIALIASLGVILANKPVHSCLWFLLTLLSLASLYVQLSAPFIAVMQVLVYAGAILVIFMFVIVLFQDAYLAIQEYQAKVQPLALIATVIALMAALTLWGMRLLEKSPQVMPLAEGYGSVRAIAQALYIDFFFPFEAVALLFLVAIVGAIYIGKKVR